MQVGQEDYCHLKHQSLLITLVDVWQQIYQAFAFARDLLKLIVDLYFHNHYRLHCLWPTLIQSFILIESCLVYLTSSPSFVSLSSVSAS